MVLIAYLTVLFRRMWRINNKLIDVRASTAISRNAIRLDCLQSREQIRLLQDVDKH